MKVNLKEKLKRVPLSPGVYLMKNSSGDIIYVGKAKNLKNRLSNYFISLGSHDRKTGLLVSQIENFDYIITDSEREALILEGNLIKKHKPRFNILLKDDKSYPYVKITKERYPQVIKTRKIINDGAKYYGPYTNVGALNSLMDLIRQRYPVRKCGRDPNKLYKKPCFYFHIDGGICPCTKKGENPEYDAAIVEIRHYFENGFEKLIEKLKFEMQGCSENMEFEKAASLRDYITSLEALKPKQKVQILSKDDIDFISIARDTESNHSLLYMFFVRRGKILGSEKILVDNEFLDNSEILRQFILQFYGGTTYIPKHIEIFEDFSDKDEIEEYLSEKKGEKVKFHVPLKGYKKEILDMAGINAQEILQRELEQELQKKTESFDTLNALQKLLGLSKIPQRIEAYDISNIMGVFSVGAMVVYENAQKKPSDYRKFKIKTEGGPDDYASMMEVLYRRHRRAIDVDSDSKGFEKFANLLFIDGGKGHVKLVKEVMRALKIDIPVAGLVKDDKHRTRAIIYGDEEYVLDRHSKLYKFVSSVQEEVHRFAIQYHRKLRSKGLVFSVLDEIKGLGEKRKKILLRHFTSLENIKKAELSELIELEGIPENIAKSVYEYFHIK